MRRQVNDWVRSGGPQVSDGYFDLADVLVTRDQPNRIGDLLDSGDGIHLSAAGYRAGQGGRPGQAFQARLLLTRLYQRPPRGAPTCQT